MTRTALKDPYMTMYHVFTWDNETKDDFFSTYPKALPYYNELCRKFESVRMCKEVYETKEAYDMGVPDIEELLDEQG